MLGLENEFSKLKGCTIKDVVLGSLNSSIIELVIENIEKEEVFLMIYCSWRLSNADKILTGWNDKFASEDTNFCKQLKGIIGHTIIDAKIGALKDIDFQLDSKRLFVFSDLFSSDIDDVNPNWDFCIPSKNICYSALSDNLLTLPFS